METISNNSYKKKRKRTRKKDTERLPCISGVPERHSGEMSLHVKENKCKRQEYVSQEINERIIILKLVFCGQPIAILGIYAIYEKKTCTEKGCFIEKVNELIKEIDVK